jgi:hypothetical protein
MKFGGVWSSRLQGTPMNAACAYPGRSLLECLAAAVSTVDFEEPRLQLIVGFGATHAAMLVGIVCIAHVVVEPRLLWVAPVTGEPGEPFARSDLGGVADRLFRLAAEHLAGRARS